MNPIVKAEVKRKEDYPFGTLYEVRVNKDTHNKMAYVQRLYNLDGMELSYAAMTRKILANLTLEQMDRLVTGELDEG